MTSLLDQYEQEKQRAANLLNVSRTMVRPELTATGYISAGVDEQKAIFTKQRINFRPPNIITHLVVNNKIIVMALVTKRIVRIDLTKPDENPDEIDILKPLGDKSTSCEIHRLYLDPTGQHLLVSASGKEAEQTMDLTTFYLSKNSSKSKIVSKAKGQLITAVGWNNYVADANTGPILIGTSRGILFETQLVAADERHLFQTHVEQYWKQVYNIGKGAHMPITAIEIYRMPNVETQYFILVATTNHLYEFVGHVTSISESPLLHQIFASYTDTSEMPRYKEIASHLTYSRLAVWSPQPQAVPKTFAWMTGAGILLGNINCNGIGSKKSVIGDTKVLQYPKDKEGPVKPLSLVLTEFHVLVLFRDRVKGFCVLDEQLVFEDIFTELYGSVVDIAEDIVESTIWAISERAVYKYRIHKEARNVWQIYLQKGDFELAKQYCRDDPVNYDKVITKQAEHYFSIGKFMESADHYATSEASFEEVTLKFLNVGQKEALKTYLLKKMQSLKPLEKTQTTMLALWVMELYLNKLGAMRDGGQKSTGEYCGYQTEFLKFLDQPRVKESISNNHVAVYDLIASHGDQEALVVVTKLMKDFERVINYHLQHGDFKAALGVLQGRSEVELFYKFSATLMQLAPKETVDLWISKGKLLQPSRLIPALVQYNPNTTTKQCGEAIRYLEYCFHKMDNRDKAIHNYLLALYAEHQPEKLITYLNLQGQDEMSVCYDLEYASRVCSEHGLHRACVHIYTTKGLYEEAVDLALKEDIELAKQTANIPDGNDELKKKLWLKIAQHVVKEENDIKKAMEFLQECDLLKIEDVLPFFPDFVTIDHFKDAICQSLQEYNQHIVVLKDEMDQATQSAQEIHTEIQTFRRKYTFVRADDKCAICTYAVMSRAFHLFPCHHIFHTDCLATEMTPHLSGTRRHRLEELQRLLAIPVAKDDSASVASSGTSATSAPGSREQYKSEIDDIIASDCFYCGDVMIKSVDSPLIHPSEKDEVLKGWE